MVHHDEPKPKEQMLLERIRTAGAEAAIVSAAKMVTFEQLRMQVETFAQSLLFDF